MDRSTISSIMRKKGQLEHGEERTDRYTDHIMDHGEKERKNQVDMARRLTHRQAETGRQIDRQTDKQRQASRQTSKDRQTDRQTD